MSRVYSHFTADGKLRRSMIQDVSGPFSENRVPLRIGVRAQTEHHVTGVVNVYVRVHDHDVLGEHHLAHAPKAVHDFEGLHWVALPDAYKNQVVKHASG